MLRHLHHGVWADGQEEPAAVVDIGLFNHAPVGLQMISGEVVGGIQLGDQGTFQTGDEHGALASRVRGILLISVFQVILLFNKMYKSKWFQSDPQGSVINFLLQ